MRCFISLIVLVCSNAFANLPYYPIQFPRDAAAHYENIPYEYNKMTEWWYYNGKLIADDGTHLSFDVAIFQGSVLINGQVKRVPMMHMQIANLDEKKNYGAINYYAMGSGKIASDQLNIELDPNNYLKSSYSGDVASYELSAQSNPDKLKLHLTFQDTTEPLLIDGTGLVDMGANTNSYYYSIPAMTAEGSIDLNGKSYHIQKTYDIWMDHQWGDFHVKKFGWEFFSIRLDNGLHANVFLNIDLKTQQVVNGVASILLPNLQKIYVPYTQFTVQRSNKWLDPRTGIKYPQTFKLNFPKLKLSLTTQAPFADQSPNGYWEGYCDISGNYNGKPFNGYSINELVYAPPRSTLNNNN